MPDDAPISAAQRRLAVIGDAARSQLWPLPALGIVVAIALGVGLTRLDGRVDGRLPSTFADYVFSGDANAARSVLGHVAGSVITVTSLTFSLTVVSLQLASSQFSPRLLRTFTRDRFVQGTLALFLATFVYALTVLRTVHSGSSLRSTEVPELSVTMAYLLTVASVLGLVLFLAHLAREIRVETMLRRVHADADETWRRVLPPDDPDRPRDALPTPPADALVITAVSSGFFTSVAEADLLDAATQTGAVVLIDRSPGEQISAGTPVGRCWPVEAGSQLGDDAVEELRCKVAEAIDTGFERTSAQDVGYALRQLTDVAVRALSPGINDPTTAVHALGHSAALLCTLSTRALGPRTLQDDSGERRVGLRRPALSELLDVAVAQPRRYGRSDPAVLGALCVLLRDLAWCTSRPDDQLAIRHELGRLRQTAAGQDLHEDERFRLQDLERQVEDALDGRWSPYDG
jgi:uncharacterized membrane protein